MRCAPKSSRFPDLGIHAVPSVILNDRHLIQGGQPPEVFEQALGRSPLQPLRKPFLDGIASYRNASNKPTQF